MNPKIFLVLNIFFISCYGNSQNQTKESQQGEPEINLKVASEGTYSLNDLVYVDKNLKEVNKDKASFYMKREVLGPQLVFNDSDTNDYWVDRQYFRNTNIVNIVFHYYDITDDKHFMSVMTNSSIEKPDYYFFNGIVVWTYKDNDDNDENNAVRLDGNYAFGVLDGNFTMRDESGKVIDSFGFDNGKRYSNLQNAEDIYKPLIGHWEGELSIDDLEAVRKVQVYDLKSDGSMEFYEDYYFNQSSYFSEGVDWQLDESLRSVGIGSWKFTPSSNDTGTITFYYKGKEAIKSSVTIINDSAVIMTEKWLSDVFTKENLGKKVTYNKH